MEAMTYSDAVEVAKRLFAETGLYYKPWCQLSERKKMEMVAHGVDVYGEKIWTAVLD